MNALEDQDLPGVQADFELMEAIYAHFEPAFGTCINVFHETEPSPVHIDIHVFEQTYHPFRTLVTSGLASKPMNVPSKVRNCELFRYAELVLFLPLDWPVDDLDKIQRPEYMWPIATLNGFAHVPHNRESWIWRGHTMGGEEASYAPDTKLCASLLTDPMLPEELEVLTMRDGRKIFFHNLVFIYREELNLCRQQGSDAYLNKVVQSGISPLDWFVLDINRRNLCS